MTVYGTGKRPERRRGPDIFVKILGWLGVFGWFLMFVALFIIDRAKPEAEFILSKTARASLRNAWDQGLVTYLFYVMILGLFISIIGIVINTRRFHREDDRFRLTMILLGIISIFGIAKYLLPF